MAEKNQTTSPLKVNNRFTPIIMLTPRQDLCQSCLKNCIISNFFFNFTILFRFRYHGTLRESMFQTASHLKVHDRFTPQNSYILLGEWLHQSFQKELWNRTFWIFNIFFLCFFFEGWGVGVGYMIINGDLSNMRFLEHGWSLSEKNQKLGIRNNY